MRLVARPVAARVHEYESIVRLERAHVPEHVPALQIAGKPVLEHQRRPVAFELVVNACTPMVSVWHIASSLTGAGRYGQPSRSARSRKSPASTSKRYGVSSYGKS